MTKVFTVRTADGKVWYFDSLETAVVKVNRTFPIADLKYGFLCYWLKPSIYGMGFAGAGDNVVFYDECGLKIPVWKVKEGFYNLPVAIREPRHRWFYRRVHVKQDHFRRLPVPHTRRWRWHREKHAKTQQERKENKFLKLDDDALEYKIRVRSNRLHVPDDRDEYPRSDYRIKNWKRHRKFQWKA